MLRIPTRRAGSCLSVMVVAGCLLAAPVRAQSDDPTTLNQRAIELFIAEKYTEALPIAERYAEGMKAQYGVESPKYANALSSVARLYVKLSRLTDAEPLYKQALAIDEKVLGPYHADVAGDLANLGLFYLDADREADAEPLMLRAVAVVERVRGRDDFGLINPLLGLAALYERRGQYAQVEQIYKRLLASAERRSGSDNIVVVHWLNYLADLLRHRTLPRRRAAAET